MGFLKKLTNLYIWNRIFIERLSEPIHLNIAALFVYIFGSYRKKIDFDLVLRSQHAFALLKAADYAVKHDKKKVTVIEFGVANGAGLYNIQAIAKKITNITGIAFDIFGFDTAEGMPPPESFKDHPDLYREGDFPMDFEKLQKALDSNTHLIIGPIQETIKKFTERNFEDSPIAFISIDVDFYSSTVESLKVLEMTSNQYLPRVTIYLDDLQDDSHNSWCGESAAVHEFLKRL
ncbi:hypothetical protein N9E88_06035 [Gammaproteobacteria bacterium]|nr:hypothetical protein [Gammaproteobacteria bacterium]